MVMLYLAAGSLQHIYQDVQNYVVIGLMYISWSNPSDNNFHAIIFILFWRSVSMVFIREYIIPNPPFQSSGQFLVILIVFRNVDFGDTQKVSFIGP